MTHDRDILQIWSYSCAQTARVWKLIIIAVRFLLREKICVTVKIGIICARSARDLEIQLNILSHSAIVCTYFFIRALILRPRVLVIVWHGIHAISLATIISAKKLQLVEFVVSTWCTFFVKSCYILRPVYRSWNCAALDGSSYIRFLVSVIWRGQWLLSKSAFISMATS